MFQLAHHVQCTITLQLQLPFRVDTGLLRTIAIGQRILCVFFRTELYALRVGDVDDCSVGVCECQTCQCYRTLIGATQGQRAVCRRAAEHISNLIAIHRVGIALHNCDVGAADGSRNVSCYIAGCCYRSRRAVIHDVHRVGIDIGRTAAFIANRHAGNVAEVDGRTIDSYCRTFREGGGRTLCHLFSRERISITARCYLQGLCLGCYCQQKDQY